MVEAPHDLEAVVDRLLKSETFRHAPSSRRLLRYLADRCLAGESDAIKEYTIGVDAFNKPTSYDPRSDSTVRIQIGRLRQKLTEYYSGEGIADDVLLSVPKGRLTLLCEPRAAAAEPSAAPAEIATSNPWRMAAIGLAAALLLSVLWTATRSRPAQPPAGWSSDLEAIWQPLINSPKPLLLAVGDPLFVQFENKTLFRDPSIDKWEDLQKSPQVTALAQATGAGTSQPVHYYSAVGDVSAAFLLGRRLGSRQPLFSLVRSSQMLWQQMADANVLFLGPPRFFTERLGNLPMPMAITESPDGFRVTQPAPGEPALYPYRNSTGYFVEDGEACVLVTRATGPSGGTDIFSIASNSTFGRLGAVAALTDPNSARPIVARMNPVPRYFQLLLRVKYKGGVPTETAYLLHRPLASR